MLTNILRSFLLLFAASLSGCAVSGSIESKKIAEAAPARIYIRLVTQNTLQVQWTVWGPAHDEGDVFGAAMAADLNQCGVQSTYYNVKPLAVDDNEKEVRDKFMPDTILELSLVRKTQSRSSASFEYRVNMADFKTKKLLWTSDVKMNWGANLGNTMANLVLTKMQADGFMNAACKITPAKVEY